jgi:hypothetical protein
MQVRYRGREDSLRPIQIWIANGTAHNSKTLTDLAVGTRNLEYLFLFQSLLWIMPDMCS